jgi:uncharacterized protein (TIGR03000 family)
MYSVVLVMALAGSAEAPDCCNGCAPRCGCCGVQVGCCGVRVGCYGGCAGYGGCMGGCMGGCVGYNNGCCGVVRMGCCGCAGMVMTGCGCVGTAPAPAAEEKKNDSTEEKKDGVNGARPATIVVNIPANARLTVNGQVMTQTSSQRRLTTPAMRPGQQFTYTLVAESTQNGQPVVQTQRVTVRAGQQLPVNFTLSTRPAAASR